MIEMTLSSRHRIRNSSPGGLRPSALPLGHGGSPQYWLSHVDGEETFLVSFKPPRPGTEPRTLAWKAAVLTTTLGPPPYVTETYSDLWSWSQDHRFCETRWPWPRLFSPSWLIQWSMGEGSYITLFSPSVVTEFHRMKYGGGGLI